MAKITRYNGNLQAFGINAVGSERYPFGNSSTQSDTLDDNVNTDYLRGWGVQGAGAKPAIEWFNGAMFTQGQLLAYLHQMGIAEYNASQEYHTGSVCTKSGSIFISKTDSNTGNDPTADIINWEALSRNSNRRLNVNGDTSVWQGGTSFSPAVAGDIMCDNWRHRLIVADGADITVSESSDIPSTTFGSSIHTSVDTAQASVAATYRRCLSTFIEGYDYVKILQDGFFTISFWVKSTKTGTTCVSFHNNALDRSYVHELTINSSDTWEYKTVTVAVDTSGTWEETNETGLEISFPLINGSNYHGTASTWQAGEIRSTSSQVNHCDSTSNIFVVKNLQVEPGQRATSFEYRNHGEELDLCMRYRFLVSNRVVASGMVGPSTTSFYGTIYLSVPMRTNPSFTGGVGDVTVKSNGNTRTPVTISVSDYAVGYANLYATYSSGLSIDTSGVIYANSSTTKLFLDASMV